MSDHHARAHEQPDAGALRVELSRRFSIGFLVSGALLAISFAVAAVVAAMQIGFGLGFWIAGAMALFGLAIGVGALLLLLNDAPVFEASEAGVRVGLGIDHLVPWNAIERVTLDRVAGMRCLVIVAADPKHSALAEPDAPGAALSSAFGAFAQRHLDERGEIAIAVIKASLLRGDAETIAQALCDLHRRHAR